MPTLTFADAATRVRHGVPLVPADLTGVHTLDVVLGGGGHH